LDIRPDDLRYITTSPNEYLYKGVSYRTMDIFYECALTYDQLTIKAKSVIKDLVWISLTQIGSVSFRIVIGERYIH
jgi:NAD+ diphosphatase